MKIKIQITSDPVQSRGLSEDYPAGAIAEFSGIVRDLENGEKISALEYEAYAPMAENEMHRILESLDEKFPCLAARVIHRVGIIPVGETAIYICVAAKHRGEAFALLAEFMNRLYINNWSNLGVGRSRYGILCREDGFIYDDGVVARTAADRFHVTTTTGGAPRVLAMMEDYRQTEWPDLKVWLTSTTEQWAVIAVQGPNARRVLEPLVEDVDLSAAALPHMGVAHGRICGVPTLLFRVSFTGELGFEVNVPADYGAAVWEAIHAAGQAHGMLEYGTETMHVLRAEKGYIIVGQDTDGTVTPDDAGLSWAVGKNKADFVGKRSLERASMKAANRKQLVGLRTRGADIVLEEGAQIAAAAGQKPPMELIGHVTSSYASSVLGFPIALALVAGGRARMGQTLYVPMPGGDLEVEVASPVFYDPTGARING